MSRHLRIAVLCLSVFAGCASQPEVAPEDPTPDVSLDEASQVISESLTRIAIGTPESLELAVLDLSLSAAGETSRGIELQNVAIEMFDILYPLLDSPGEAPAPFSPASIYPQMFASVRRGEYPEVPQQSVSYLTLIIPPLSVLFTDSQQIQERSRETLLQAEALNSDSIVPDLLLGLIAERNNEIEEAAARYASAAAESSRAYPARIGLARIELDRGNVGAAIEAVDRLREELPASAEVLALAARAYYLDGRNAQADSLIQEAIKRESDNQAAIGLLLLRAQILAASGNYSSARNLLTIVEPRRPDDADVMLLKAELLAAGGEYGEALTVMKRARGLYPDDTRINDAYGRLLVRAGNVDEGRRILESSLEISPSNVVNLRVLLDNAMQSERWTEAAEYVDRLLAIEERDEYLATAIDIRLRLNDYDAAATYAGRRYRKNPDDFAILKQYATILIELDRTDVAEEVLRRAVEVADDRFVRSDLFYLLSLISGTRDEKFKLLREALQLNLQNFDALVAYSALFEETGDTKRALWYLREASKLRPEDEALARRVEKLSQEEGK